jgi:hypothetical protein
MALTTTVQYMPDTGATGKPTAQSVTATAASTTEQAIADNSTGGAIYEFVAAGFAHIKLGLTGVGAATTAHRLITSTPVRFRIDPAIATHIRAIRNGAADVIVSFNRVPE